MRSSDKEGSKVEFTEQFKKRALELLDETQAIQFAEGLRLNSASNVVFQRELDRLTLKHGADDRRTKEMAVRLEASTEANKTLFARFTEATTPQPTSANEGWAVDGFVRAPTGAPVPGLTVAIYDSKETKIREFGQSTTDDRGHFSISAEKLPTDLAVPVFVRVSKGTKVLPSNEVRLEPARGRSERVEIIIGDRDDPKDPKTGDTKPIETRPSDTKPDVGKPAEPAPDTSKPDVTKPGDKPDVGTGSDGPKVPGIDRPTTVPRPTIAATVARPRSAAKPKTKSTTSKTAKKPAKKTPKTSSKKSTASKTKKKPTKK